MNPHTGFVHDSILSEGLDRGGTRHHFTEVTLFDRFQLYPEFLVYYRRVVGERGEPHRAASHRCSYHLPT